MPAHLFKDLDALKKKLLSYGAAVEENLSKSLLSLVNSDADLAEKVIERDHELDKQEVIIEDDCLKILALHQPVAMDLRYVIVVLKMNNDLERIGDFAVNIAKRAKFLATHEHIEIPAMLTDMGQKAGWMLQKSLDSLVDADADAAWEVCAFDDTVDNLWKELYAIVRQEILNNPRAIDQWLQVFSVIRYFERIGDLSTNIAEDVIYLVEGTVVRHQGGSRIPGG